jgi:hypothetical protein
MTVNGIKVRGSVEKGFINPYKSESESREGW